MTRRNLFSVIVECVVIFLITTVLTTCGGSINDANQGVENLATTEFEQRLAYRWAPVLYQSIHGKADLITTYDYDGDLNLRNNWDNLFSPNNYPLKGAAYYSVVSSYTHWFIVYGYYFPRDWDNAEQHENDFEIILLVVRRPTCSECSNPADEFGYLEVMATEQHGDFFNFRAPDSLWGASDGIIEFEHAGDMNYSRPIIAQECKGHGIKAYPTVPHWPGEIGNCYSNNFLKYIPNMKPVETLTQPIYSWFKEICGPEGKWRCNQADYALVDIFTTNGMWAQQMANNPDMFVKFGNFAGDDSGDCGRYGGWVYKRRFPCEVDSANAAWNQGPYGSFAIDPIYFVSQEDFIISGNFSRDYDHNQYLDSLMPTPEGSLVTIYRDIIFRGLSKAYYSTGEFDIETLNPVGNDAISSIVVAKGYEALLYPDFRFRGAPLVVRGSIENLKNNSFNDIVSSIRIQPAPAKPPIVTAYHDFNYLGKYVEYYDVGDYDIGTLGPMGNDAMSSIVVADGYEALLYPDSEFRGAPLIVTGSIAYLGTYGFNDRVSSIRIQQVAQPVL